jgi:hypothetical protein
MVVREAAESSHAMGRADRFAPRARSAAVTQNVRPAVRAGITTAGED